MTISMISQGRPRGALADGAGKRRQRRRRRGMCVSAGLLAIAAAFGMTLAAMVLEEYAKLK